MKEEEKNKIFEVLNERDKIKKKLYYKDLAGWFLIFSLSFAVISLFHYLDTKTDLFPNIDGLYLICFVSYASLILSYICYSEFKD